MCPRFFGYSAPIEISYRSNYTHLALFHSGLQHSSCTSHSRYVELFSPEDYYKNGSKKNVDTILVGDISSLSVLFLANSPHYHIAIVVFCPCQNIQQ